MKHTPEEQPAPDESQVSASSVGHGMGIAVRGVVEGNPADREKTIEDLNAEIEPIGLKIVNADTPKTKFEEAVERLSALGLNIDKDRIIKAGILRERRRRRI